MPRRFLAGLGVVAGVFLVWAVSCGPESAMSVSGSTATAESGGGTTQGSAATGEATDPTGATGTTGTMEPGDMCEAYLDADELLEPILISVRNDAQVPLFLPFGSCGVPSLFTITALSDGATWVLGGCRSTCEVPFCPNGCGQAGSLMIAPGGVVEFFEWDGRLSAPSVRPAACGDGEGDMQCDVLRRAEAGEHSLSVLFSKELLGCDPDPCTCDFDGFDFCQVWDQGDAVPQFSTEIKFVMPTAGPIVVSLSL